jgi:hypothetical protein
MIAIPPPELALHLSIVASAAAVSLLLTGLLSFKKRAIAAFLMSLYRFFIQEAAV